jgi:hypothetical protein
MAYEQKDNSGSLFKNDKREKDTHANARGSAMIDGVHYWVDAWTNTAQSGDKYQSLKFKRKDAPNGSQGAPVQRAAPPPLSPYDDDSDVPFISSENALEWRVS